MKIVIIGAGSASFSATIVRDLCVNRGLQGSHVVFMDIDETRLKTTLKLSERLTEAVNGSLSFEATTSREAALTGADYVINTAQYFGHTWTEEQRSIAERHGYYRGTTVIGLHHITQMAFFSEIARDMERICPDAYLFQISNPVFEGCALMTRTSKLKIIGLCHGHYGYRKIAEVLGLEREHIAAVMPGFNHWIFMTEFRYRGRDAYPILDEWIKTKAESYWAQLDSLDAQMSRAAIDQYKLYGFMPVGDTPRIAGWQYNSSLEDKVYWYGKKGGFDSEIGWGEYLEELSKKAHEIEDAAYNQLKPITETFEARQSDEQVVPIISSIVNDCAAMYQVNIPNKGRILPDFPEDIVVECRAMIDAGGIHAVHEPPFPSKLLNGAMRPRYARAEALVEALRLGDYDLLRSYMLSDPKTRSLKQVDGMLAEWLSHEKSGIIAKIFQK